MERQKINLSLFSWATTRTIKERISNMKTSLLGDIDIIYTTNELIDCYFYEYLMKLVLKKYRIKPNKEMFNVYEDDIKMIFDFINELNTIFNSEEKLYLYIENYHPEYLKKRKYVKSETSSSNKPKRKKKGLFIDTSY